MVGVMPLPFQAGSGGIGGLGSDIHGVRPWQRRVDPSGTAPPRNRQAEITQEAQDIAMRQALGDPFGGKMGDLRGMTGGADGLGRRYRMMMGMGGRGGRGGMGMGGMGIGPWRGDLLDEASKILDDLFEDLFQEASEDLADLFEEPVADLEGLLEEAAEQLVEDQFDLVVDEMADRIVSEVTERLVGEEEAQAQ